MSPNESAAQGQTSIDVAVRAINELIAATHHPLIDLSLKFSEIYHSFFDSSGTDERRISQLANELEPQCLEILSQPAPRLIEGIGLVWVASENSSGMLWWRAEKGTIARKHHVFNPDSDSFYDYRNSVWFRGALESEGLSIVGPYVDSWGTDDHTLTSSMKMDVSGGGLLAVAAADLNLQNLITEIEKILPGLPNTVLVSNEDRVIASSVALLTPGLRLEPFLAKAGVKVITRQDTALETWQLVELS